MQTAKITKPNQTQTDITVEELSQSILAAEEHLTGVSVETVFRKGKRFPVFKTTGGIRFQYITQTKDNNPIYMMKETNTDGKTVKADLTQDDIKSFQATIAPLKEIGMLKAHLGKDEDGNAAVRAGTYVTDNIYTDVTVGSENTEINLNLDLTDSITVTGSAGSDGDTGIGIFYERDY